VIQKKKLTLLYDQKNHTISRISIILLKIRTEMIEKLRKRNLEEMTWKLILKLPEELQG